MNFASDNVFGIHPKILAAIQTANDGTSEWLRTNGPSR